MGIKGFFRAIGRFFTGAAKDVYESVKELLQSETVKAIYKNALGAIVEQAVIEVQNLPLSGQERRIEAFKRIGAVAAAQGIEAKNSLVNLLIELAVSKLKAVGEEVEKS